MMTSNRSLVEDGFWEEDEEEERKIGTKRRKQNRPTVMSLVQEDRSIIKIMTNPSSCMSDVKGDHDQTAWK
jgi:hypothetical protein